MKKRLLALTMAFAMAFTMAPLSVSADPANSSSQSTEVTTPADSTDSSKAATGKEGSENKSTGKTDSDADGAGGTTKDADSTGSTTDSSVTESKGSTEGSDSVNTTDSQTGTTDTANLINTLDADTKNKADLTSEVIEEGYYVLTSKLADNLVLDIAAASQNVGANVQVYTYNGSPAQIYYIKAYTDSEGKVSYTISPYSTAGKSIDVYGARTTNGTNVWQYTTNNSAAQRWIFTSVNKKADPEDSSSSDSSGTDGSDSSSDSSPSESITPSDLSEQSQSGVLTEATASEAEGSASKENNLITTKEVNSEEDEGYFFIHSALATEDHDIVLDVNGGIKKAGTNVSIYAKNGTDAQKWKLTKLDITPFPEGLYDIHPYANSGQSVDIASGSPDNFANVQVYASNNSDAQKFYVRSLGYGGYYKIINCASYKAIDVSGASTRTGTNISMYTDNGTDAQTWQIIDTGKTDSKGNKVYNLKSKVGTYMSISGSNVQTGGSADVSKAGWTFTSTSYSPASVSNGVFFIASKVDTNKVFDIPAASQNQTAQLQLYARNGSNAQKFKIQSAGNGYVYLIPLHSGQYLNVAGGTAANNTKVWQYRYDGTNAEKFKLVDTGDGDGSVYLQYYNTSFNIDVPGAQAVNGKKLYLYSANGSAAQKFYFIKTTTSKGWQYYLGKYRYVYDSNGNYYKNTTVDGLKVGSDGQPYDQWVVRNGYYRYWTLSTKGIVNDVRPYLTKLFGSQSVKNCYGAWYAAPKCSYKATVDRTRCLVTIYTKYPGTSNWNLPVCAFKCSPGTNASPTDAGARTTIERAGTWSILMGPSYGQFATRLSPYSAGELFHSVASGQLNNHNLDAATYNLLGTKQSHGCIRLDVRNAYWIYTYCQLGMEVYVGDNLAAPIGSVPQPKMYGGTYVDPTDVNYTRNYEYADSNRYYGRYYF